MIFDIYSGFGVILEDTGDVQTGDREVYDEQQRTEKILSQEDGAFSAA